MNVIVAAANKEVGVREDVGKNNTGERIKVYQKSTWLDPGAWPWCAAFCCWILKEALKDATLLSQLKLNAKSGEEWRCKDASAFGWTKWATKKGLKVLPPTQLAKAGDFVVFEFSHIGLVVEDQVSVKYPIKTIEGNTNGQGDRDSTSGDGVWRKMRNPSLVKNYIRIV